MFELPPPEDDGLYIPEVGDWSRDKHYFLQRYIDAFTTAMKGKWRELHYIDLFANAGIERLRESRQLNWGSPLIAAQAPKPFDHLHLCELDEQKIQALSTRVKKLHKCSQIIQGDANDKIHDIVKKIPQGSLSLAFLDPYSLQLDFETLTILSNKRADLIIFFPDRLDILRNWQTYYYDNQNSKLDSYLGPGSNWRGELDSAAPQNRVEVLRQIYLRQIEEKLGYSYFRHERIPSTGRPLYSLIFCTRHKRGQEFWDKITRIQRGGQRRFDF